MFGLDMKAIEQQMQGIQQMAQDQKKLAQAVETLNTLLPKMISELERLNANMEKQ